ncbi:hypothetical protein BH18ACT4_BH18ACT4_02390 [soil metagenome]
MVLAWGRIEPMTAEHWHGTYNGYANRSCRCPECRAANTVHNQTARARRTALLASGQITRPHGVYATYVNYGCRCDECCDANRRRRASLRSRRGL